jgi:hypothetical protein
MLIILLFIPSTINVLASDGEMGYSGGISEGENLPKTIEKYVESKTNKNTKYKYKEVVFISGEPVIFEGTMQINKKEVDFEKGENGTYTERYSVVAENKDEEAKLNRTINFNTSYRVIDGLYKKQIIRDSEVTNWDERITIDGKDYKVDEDLSKFSKSSVEDITPGVKYLSTLVSYSAEYVTDEDEKIVVNSEGSIYGYSQPWSKVESHNISMNIDADDWQMDVELKPTLEAKKSMFYNKSDPFPISFSGTYNQRMEREAVLTYKILSHNSNVRKSKRSGSIMITSANEVEKLQIPEHLDFLQGHWAEDDIKKLYSMEIFTDIPYSGMQYKAISRGEFVKALCRAMDIDTSKYENANGNSPVKFGDVPYNHPLYKYIMGANDSKLVLGKGDIFDVSKPITREEAFVIYIRIIGLERLGISNSPITPFVDDKNISPWAKKEIMAGFKLGIIQGNDGKVLPKQWISKAQAAAIINRLIDYLRDDIAIDYKI